MTYKLRAFSSLIIRVRRWKNSEIRKHHNVA